MARVFPKSVTCLDTLVKYTINFGSVWEKPYECKLCDYSSTTTGALKTHSMTHNAACESCDFVSHLKYSWIRHMQKSHKKILYYVHKTDRIKCIRGESLENYKCQECDLRRIEI